MLSKLRDFCALVKKSLLKVHSKYVVMAEKRLSFALTAVNLFNIYSCKGKIQKFSDIVILNILIMLSNSLSKSCLSNSFNIYRKNSYKIPNTVGHE